MAREARNGKGGLPRRKAIPALHGGGPFGSFRGMSSPLSPSSAPAEKKAPSRRIPWGAVKLLVMVLLLGFLYWKIDFAQFADALGNFGWWALPAAYGMLFFNTCLNSWKWGLLLASDGVAIPFPRLVASHLVATFFNLFMPSSIGGDVYRIVDVGMSAGGARSFASVFCERLVGFLALAVWGLVFSLVGWRGLPDKRILLLPVAVFALMAIVTAAVVQRRALEWAMRLFRLDRFAPKLHAFARGVLDSVAVYRSRPRLLLGVFALSLVFQMVVITTIFLLSRALGWQVPFPYFCIFVPLITLGEALPISIFGIGVRDGLYVLFFSFAGVAREKALALSMVYVFVSILYSLLGGIVFLFKKRAKAAA